ncbi:unnamed protein product [Triticum turgidum subsp. durum]|uniref:Cytochrome b561 domain-containing protein n=1 Tax=Triticum turgidum subsp. durum TaxID=4567 RepID=A0A9R1A2T0_TRITD|nr:unnamed protein product [Triticum turgidum subsp. durum]
MKAGASPPASRAAGVRTLVVHVLAVAATALVLFWCIGFRGGLAFRSSDKQRIFNVHPPLMLIGLVLGFLEKLTFLQSPPARLVGKYGAEALLVNFTAVIVLLLGIAVVIATVNADSTRYTAM